MWFSGTLGRAYQNRMTLSDPLEMRRRMEGITNSALTKSAWPGVEDMSSFVCGERSALNRKVDFIAFTSAFQTLIV